MSSSKALSEEEVRERERFLIRALQERGQKANLLQPLAWGSKEREEASTEKAKADESVKRLHEETLSVFESTSVQRKSFFRRSPLTKKN